MGGVSRQSHAATFPPERFYCLLDELPLHLIPRHALDAGRKAAAYSRTFYRNPDCELRSAENLPREFLNQKEMFSGFAIQGKIAWVRDARSGSLLPFWLGPEFEATFRQLRLDQPVPASLPANMVSVLAGAGILISEEAAAQSLLNGRTQIGIASKLFRERGYAPLVGLIHPFHVAALRRYYRHQIRSGAFQLGDRQNPLRYVAYNEPVARFFHQQITSTLSAVAGEPLKPSYVYLASYLGAAELKKHTDREQCEFSITLSLDFSPEPALATPWPIHLDTPAGTVAVHQALGDGLAYRGTRLPHYREKLRAGQTSTSIFFHYVSADFAGPLD